MDPQGLELSKTSARAAAPWAAGLGAIFLVMGLIPCLGGCVNFFLSLGGFVAVGYFLTPRLTSSIPMSLNRTMAALYIGIGTAVVVTIGFVIATIVDRLLFMALGSAISSLSSANNIFGSAVSGFVGLILAMIFTTGWGLIAGTGLAFLGSYLSLNRTTQPATRPF